MADTNGANGFSDNELLWKHPSPKDSKMWDFLQRVNQKYNKNFQSYHELYQWSIENISDAWGEIWDYCGIRTSQPYKRVVSDEKTMFPRPSWFEGAKLNFAENLLFPIQPVDENSLAVIAATETTREHVSWKQLRDRVRQCQAGLRAINVKPGDRIGGYVANHTNALVAMLAASSLGAIWTAVSPDTGVTAVLDRMVQIEPVALFTDNAVMYNGKTHPVLPKVKEIMQNLPTLKAVVVFETVPSMGSQIEGASSQDNGKIHTYQNFTKLSTSQEELHFEQLDPDHPVYILYSSGTTGAPKCIVHGAIGTVSSPVDRKIFATVEHIAFSKRSV